MPQISEIELYEVSAQPILSIRVVMPFSEFPERADIAFKKISTYLGSINGYPAGSPVVCYHNTDLEHLDVEIGFPVTDAVADREDIRYVVHPGGRCAAGICQGPYEDSDPLMMKMFEWITSRGLKAGGRIYNEYLNDTQRPPQEWLLRIRIPVQ